MKGLREKIEDWLTAVIFAEAGLAEIAREFLGPKKLVQQPRTLEFPAVKIR